jgi:hypothetical protein
LGFEPLRLASTLAGLTLMIPCAARLTLQAESIAASLCPAKTRITGFFQVVDDGTFAQAQVGSGRFAARAC